MSSMRKFVSAVSASLFFASGALAHGVPDMRLVVGSLAGQTLRDCERSSVRALRRYGLTTSVTRQDSSVVKVWGTSNSRLYSIQVECDTSMQIKAVAFSHPVTHDSREVNAIFDSLFR